MKKLKELVMLQKLNLKELAEAKAQKARDLKEVCELPELELKAEQEKALLEAEKEAAACKHE